MDRLAIAVVQGGPSPEAEVSRASAAGVAAALGESGHRVVRLELNGFLPESLRTGGYDVVFPVAHGAVGEDGCLQGLLELLELPYVGSGVLASALAMDKRQARVAFGAAGLPIAKGMAAGQGGDARALAEEALAKIGARLVVKPATGGSAIGVTRLDQGSTAADVAKAIEEAWRISSGAAIIEHFARGREVTCGVLELDGAPVALPPTEITSPHDAFYTYEARYAPGRSVHACPAPLGPALTARVQEVAVGAHVALGCRDLSRVDFVVGDAGDAAAVTLLEVNTLPGFTATSLYPEAAGVAGHALPSLVDRLVRQARRRGTTRRVAALPLPR
jgi:D-alanine-D-alanine ligase